MALYRIFPEKDSFISTEFPLSNSGRDELLEVGGYRVSAGGQTLRTLIQFDTTELKSVLTDKVGITLPATTGYKANLHLSLNSANELPINYSINVHPLAEAWDEGNGKFGDIPINQTGCGWNFKLAGGTTDWTTGSEALTSETGNGFTVAENELKTTGSYQPTLPGGGYWYFTSGSNNVILSGSATFNKNSNHDLDIDVTKLTQYHSNEWLSNYGMILKLDDNLEFNTSASVKLKYYGEDTNTIYPPYLEIKWDDYSHTSSLSEVTSSEVIVSIRNNKGKYIDEGKQRFRVNARPKYPTRTFTTSSAYTTNYTLPTSSYWGLRDENTEEMLVDFDTTYTKLSADNTSNYFDIYMDGLQPERYYRLLIKTEIDGSTSVIDNNQVFKVVRNG
jgi:hypothetical protein